MATAYPGALDAANNQLRTDIAQTDDLDASGKEHDVMHVNAHGAIIAVETKLGTGSSSAFLRLRRGNGLGKLRHAL